MNGDQKFNRNVIASNNTAALNGNGNRKDNEIIGSKASSIDVPPMRVSTMKLVDVIDVNQFPRTIITTAISRTHHRITHENQIIKLLTNYLKKFDYSLRMMPFGSSTYGFGGSNTNFNVLINARKQK